jgi:hypothetical protein
MANKDFILEGKNIPAHVTYKMPERIPVPSSGKVVVHNILYNIEIAHKMINENLYSFHMKVTYNITSKCEACGGQKQQYFITGFAKKGADQSLQYTGNGIMNMQSPMIKGTVYNKLYDIKLESMKIINKNNQYSLDFFNESGIPQQGNTSKEYGEQKMGTNFHIYGGQAPLTLSH